MKHLIFISIFLLSFSSSFGQEKYSLENKYLLVIDIQDCFLKKVADSTRNQLLAEVNAIIQQANPDKVIYVQSILRTLSITKKGFQIDTVPDLDFAKGLSIVNHTIFTKTKPNAFTNAQFSAYLKEHKVKDIAIVGLMAEHCVSATASGGLDLDYQMYIIPGAILGKSLKTKAKVIRKLQQKGVTIL